MNEEKRYKKLGSVKPKDLSSNFDIIRDRFKKKALDEGYTGTLKFIKEKGKVVIFTEIFDI